MINKCISELELIQKLTDLLNTSIEYSQRLEERIKILETKFSVHEHNIWNAHTMIDTCDKEVI